MRLTLTCFAMLASLGFASAQAQIPATGSPPPPAETNAPSSATTDQQIAMLQKHVALQEEKVRAISEDMVAIDQGVERKVSMIIDRLTAITDSTDSDTKVVNQKRKIIEALKKSIDFYRKQREERKSQLMHATYANVTDADLQHDMSNLDQRVEQRIDQILQVTSSLAQDTDYEQYDRYATDYNGRRVGVNEHVQQAENSNLRSVNAKSDVVEGLQRDKDRLRAENARLEQQLTLTRDSDTTEFLKESIAWNKELILRRDEQVATMITPSAGGQQPVNRKAANELGNLFDEMRLDIKADYRQLLSLKSRRDQERSRLKLLTEKLERVTATRDAAPATSPAP